MRRRLSIAARTESPPSKADTPRSPQGMFVQPGTYQVRLTVDGRSFRQPVVVRMDPRVKTSLPDLTLQFTLSKTVAAVMRRLMAERAEAERALTAASADGRAKLEATLAALRAAYAPLPALFDTLQRADTRPTPAVQAAVDEAIKRAESVLTGIGSAAPLR